MMHRQAGFSLIELIIAFTVLSIAGAGLFYVTTAATRGNTQGVNHAAAMQLAVQKIEELKNAGYGGAESGADAATIDAGGEDDGVYSRSWTVTPTALAGVPAKQFTVTVSWIGGAPISLSGVVVETRPVLAAPNLQAFSKAFVRSWDQIR